MYLYSKARIMAKIKRKYIFINARNVHHYKTHAGPVYFEVLAQNIQSTTKGHFAKKNLAALGVPTAPLDGKSAKILAMKWSKSG